MDKIKLYTEEQVLRLCYEKIIKGNTEIDVPKSKITTSDAINEFIQDETITEIPVIFPSRKTDFSSFKHYRRFPIQLDSQSIIVINHFSNSREGLDRILEEHDFTEENEAAGKLQHQQHEIAAKQFFDQLEGQYSDVFLEALIIEATKKLNEGDYSRFMLSEKAYDSEKFDNRAKKALEKADKFTKIQS